MNFDYKIDVLKDLLKSLYVNFDAILGIGESKNEKISKSKYVLLRHDIDKNPLNALKIARMEHEMGIHGTFYFRIHPSVFKPEIIREIATLGHEIGYHYEDFTACHGNPEKAIVSFQTNLALLRNIFPVTTICMDGRPLSKYNNLDLWKYYNYKDFGIECETYLDFDFNKVLYLTDTGRGWNLVKYNVRDKVFNPHHYQSKTTKELIKDLEEGKLPDQVMITIHPQRWTDNVFDWTRELVMQNVKNQVKYLLLKMGR